MIKAIETHYNGYRFRSRLEARWAVFFDALGVRYEYEPEGFELSTGWYLPDFWLPELNLYAEIKSSNENIYAWEHVNGIFQKVEGESESNLECLLKVLLISGMPGEEIAYDYTADVGFADEGLIAQCPQCKRTGFAYGGWAGYIGCLCFVCKCPKEVSRYGCKCGKPYKTSGRYHHSFQRAITAARSARFEHGETPRTI